MSGWPAITSQDEAWAHLDTQILAAAAAAITFSGIAASAAPRLRLYAYVIKDGTAGAITLQLNNDGAGNYGFQDLTGNDTTISGARATAQTAVTLTTDDSQDNDTPALYVVEIAKPIAGDVGRGKSAASYLDASAVTIMLERHGFEWTNTADLIDRVDILIAGGTGAVAGTRVVLEGAA